MSVMTQLIIQVNDSVKKYLKIYPFFIWPSGSSFKTQIVLLFEPSLPVLAILKQLKEFVFQKKQNV